MVLTFIPIELYTSIYYTFIALFVVFTLLKSALPISDGFLASATRYYFGWVLLFVVIIYMGLRPVSGYFTDMVTYSSMFDRMSNGLEVGGYDHGFYVFMQFFAQFLNKELFFLGAASVYVYSLWFASKRLFKSYAIYGFLFFICSFSFWAYGVNGIRSGLASSIFIVGLVAGKPFVRFFIFVLAVSFHLSMALPAALYYLAGIFRSIKACVYIWLVSILASLSLGERTKHIVTKLMFVDDHRISYFSAEIDGSRFSTTGFRWDFLIYSSLPILVGLYWIFRRDFRDPFYEKLLRLYILCNSFWVLAITVPYSNRFAYLSWFFMGLIISFPIIRHAILNGGFFARLKLSSAIAAYYGLTIVLVS